ncbi:sodium-coupled monocarboxylate transporter 1 [Aethina tumida]|uniref:sodium-coupled monocarboxylate transporter 1 n=1 Tax=Aethina tumida TaxID=116153 RepID=UPI002149649C|nr:sodium-coupled monocarboxylate transporter 1 [Aethina tumida]
MENFTQWISTTAIPDVVRHVSFSWYDYILFSVMLLLSSVIGIYFGCFGNKQSTAVEYLMGGKQMKVIPIAISLVASHTSGITLLALPADIYKFGASYWLGCISMLLLIFVTIYVYLPVFYQLGITSTYEYLERRFDNRVRQCASGLFALSLFVYLPIVTYIPALAFSAASGVSVHLITPLVCGVCIFYTTIGGLKAVVWTDTLQFTITIGAMFTVFFLGINQANGITTVWNKALEGQRLDIFNFDPNPTTRDSFWAIIIGLTVHWIGHTSVNQGCVQKFLAVATWAEAKKSVAYYCLGMIVVKTVCVLQGLIMYTMYSDCDPFTTKHITNKDQLLPYYVMDVAQKIPGLSGLFIAGVFCAALSTLSANLNCLAGTIYEDFLSTILTKHNSHKTAGYILKLIVIVAGIISTLMVYIVEHLGGLLALSIGLGSVAHGPVLGMFTLGMLFPRANSKGAFWGAITSVVCMLVIIFGGKYYEQMGMIHHPGLPLSVDGCDFPVNTTITSALNNTIMNGTSTNGQPLFFFRFSFYYNTLIGTIISMVVGLIISYATEKDEKEVDRSVLSPVVHFLLPKDKNCDKNGYYSVDKALELVINETDIVKK